MVLLRKANREMDVETKPPAQQSQENSTNNDKDLSAKSEKLDAESASEEKSNESQHVKEDTVAIVSAAKSEEEAIENSENPSEQPQKQETTGLATSTAVEANTTKEVDSSTKQSAKKSLKRPLETKTTERRDPIVKIGTVRNLMKQNCERCTGESTEVLAKATELFIASLVDASFENLQKRDRKTLQYEDVSSAVAATDELGFLKKLLPTLD